MKKKLISIISGVLIGLTISSCAYKESDNVLAKSPNYMKYCGRQIVADKEAIIEVYEDTDHGKLVYIVTNKDFVGANEPIAISVINK